MQGVLEGIKVLDFSRIFAGPDAAQTLGDLGAEVIKIEDPKGGDGCRPLGVTDPNLASYGAAFHSFNRNKRSLTLDLQTPEGQKIAGDLIAEADVIINNFRPGTMDRFGLGYEAMSKRNPKLIYCDFFAFGDKGELRNIGANDLQLQAHSGLMSITGELNGPPVRAGSAIVDLHAGQALVTAVLAALLHRGKTGKGQRVSTSLLQSAAHLMGYLYQEYWMTGYAHKAMGTANHLNVPNQAFPTKDGYVIIIAANDEMWKRCCTALEATDLIGGLFVDRISRLKNAAALVTRLSEVTRGFTSQEVFERLGKVKVNVAIVQDIPAASEDPQLEAIGAVHHVEVEGVPRRYIAAPFTLYDTPTKVHRVPPRLGAQSDEVLAELGYTPEQIAELRGKGII